MREKALRGSAQVFLFALLLTPATILLHELGHLSVALLAGRSADLHPTSVTGGALAQDPVWIQAAQAGAGPLVTLILTAIGLIAFRRTGRLWAMTLAAAAISRVVTDLGYLCIRLFLFVIGKPFGGDPNFDELAFARLVGLNELLAAALASLLLLGTLWLLWRWAQRGRRAVYFAAMTLGIVLAYAPMSALGNITIAKL